MALLKGIDVIRRWVIKTRLKEQAKEGGVAITLPKKEFVDLNTSITADRLLRSGVDIEQLTSPNQVDNLINQINKRSVISQGDPRFQGIMEGLMGKRGEVVDMTGKKIPPGSKIMGGKEVPGTSSRDRVRKEMKEKYGFTDERLDEIENTPIDEKMADDLIRETDVPPGSRGGPEDIAAPVQSAEESTTNLMDSTIQKMLKMEPINAMKEANKVIKREGIYKALDKNQAKKILDDTEDYIFQRDPIPKETDIPDEDITDEVTKAYTDAVRKGKFKGTEDQFRDMIDKMMDEDFATGGRVGLKSGMTRRAFLKLMGGVGASIGAAKTGILKLAGKEPAKQVVKEVVKTPPVAGKPEWFDSLVNKVIAEGEDVTKNFATKDREIVHMKKIDDETTVKVTQDLDDESIMVDIDDPVRNVMGEQGDTTIMLRFKKGQADETTKGKPADEFDATEADMRNYMDGPDDYTTEFVDNTVTDVKDLTSDLTKIKSYATGKKPTMKEFVESKKRREAVKYAEERPAEYAADRGPQYDYGDEDIELYTDYARGGLAGMLGE